MAGLRFTELQTRPMEFLDFTSVTSTSFSNWSRPSRTRSTPGWQRRMDGKPRTARRFTVYKNCPLPTPEDRVLFILVYLKTYALQVVHGRLFGWSRAKPISGFTCSCPRCRPRCAPSAMPRPDPSRLSRNGWVFRRRQL